MFEHNYPNNGLENFEGSICYLLGRMDLKTGKFRDFTTNIWNFKYAVSLRYLVPPFERFHIITSQKENNSMPTQHSASILCEILRALPKIPLDNLWTLLKCSNDEMIKNSKAIRRNCGNCVESRNACNKCNKNKLVKSNNFSMRLTPALNSPSAAFEHIYFVLLKRNSNE